ncbi:MAG: PaaI family thioesterase, partial [Raineya sp.]|nr:PaaI family thioesterase [Raineya sp.]
ALILDEVIGMTVAALEKPYPSVSINLVVDFIGKAQKGDTIVAKANVIRKGRQIIQMKGEILHLDGTLISQATSNMLNLLPK